MTGKRCAESEAHAAMQELRAVRERKGLTRAQIAAVLGISSNRLAEYESGLRSPELSRLSNWLEVLGIRRGDVALPEDFAASYPDTYRLQVDAAPTWATVRPGYHREYQETNPYLEVPAWFRRAVRVDSALEALAWTQIADGATRFRALSPVQAGFRHHFLADAEGQPLGALAKACFHSEQQTTRLLIWPQISLLLEGQLHRVDALVHRQTTRKSTWHVVEIDGDQHFVRSERDRRRDSRLAVPVHRFTQNCIRALQFKQQLFQSLAL